MNTKIYKYLFLIPLFIISFVLFKTKDLILINAPYYIGIISFNIFFLIAIFSCLKIFKLNLKKTIYLSTVFTSIVILFTNAINKPFNYLIAKIINIDVVYAIMDNGYMAWGLFLLLIISIVNYFHKPVKDLNARQNIIFKNGLTLYPLISITIFVFTHFLFIASKNLYLGNKVQLIENIIDQSVWNVDVLSTSKNFTVENRRISLPDVSQFLYKKIAEHNQNNNASKYINDIIMDITSLKQGENLIENHDLQFYTNKLIGLNLYKINEGDIVIARYLESDNQKKIPTQYLTFVVKTIENKTFIYFDITSDFKTSNQNIIFLLSYTLFHIFFLLCLLWVLKHHAKK